MRRLSVIPDAVVASAKDRPDAALRTVEAVGIEQESSISGDTASLSRLRVLTTASAFATQQLPPDVRAAALAQVTDELQKEGLLDESGEVSDEARRRYDWECDMALPTPGVVVKACPGDCSACEPELEKSIQLDLERKQLENALLQRQIDLLDKSQEYRCCPDSDAESPSP